MAGTRHAVVAGIIAVCFTVVHVVAVSTLSSCSPPRNEAASPFRIGHVAALSGPAAPWGRSEQDSLNLILKSINDAGGVLGRRIELITLDSRSTPSGAADAARRLIEENEVVAIIGPSQSSACAAVARVTASARIPFVATTATHPSALLDSASGRPYPTAFRVCPPDTHQGLAAAHFARDSLGLKTAGILYDPSSDYSVGLYEAFARRFAGLGGSVIPPEAVREGDKLGISKGIGRLAEAGPDLLFLPLSPRDGAHAMRTARERRLASVFIGADNWYSYDTGALAGNAGEGAYLVNLAAPDDPAVTGFVDLFKQTYGYQPLFPNAALAVDALELLVDAIGRSGKAVLPRFPRLGKPSEKASGEALLRALAETKNLKTLTGSLTVHPTTHEPVQKQLVVQQMRGGRFVFVEKVRANAD